MAQTTWILVANASRAKLFANLGPNKGLALVKEMEHPESRQKNSDLVSDRAGNMSANGHGRGSPTPHTFPKTHEAQVFAQTLARELNHGRSTNCFKRAIIVAPPSMMGMLNTNLDAVTASMVSDRFEKDYTSSNEKQLASHLEGCIYL